MNPATGSARSVAADPRSGAPGGDGAIVEAVGLAKAYGSVRAVDGVGLAVAPGELVALLGPSGCGKTTTLRLIAGFERPDTGTVRLAGEEVAGPGRFVPAEQRRIGVVFQDLALFPHLTVAQNLAYGVRDRSRRTERVGAMLDLVGLAGLGDRLPHELSGGQQQRVALGRSLAPEPAVVLLDEPFSSLDPALRVRLRGDLREILTAAGATAILVTHDQEEALSLADRIAVMREGRILQLDAPQALYADPVDAFVATFVGDADLLPGTAAGGEVVTELGVLRTQPDLAGEVDVVMRPESVRAWLDGSGIGWVRHVDYFGHDQVVEVVLPSGRRVRARLGTRRDLGPGDRVSVAVAGDVLAFRRT